MVTSRTFCVEMGVGAGGSGGGAGGGGGEAGALYGIYPIADVRHVSKVAVQVFLFFSRKFLCR
jgi:hypothetical protein